ncbi:lysozyme A/C-like [Drosophila innubila]|uniref:lysozyme A/C-like n=1 Tax=Drosophila innubila TaxID=198719 RepID=UPI00148CC580|nr:lysozyme A/C-like [Drosophila innubila]
MKAFIVLVALAFAAPAFGRTMDRCSLAREMAKLGVPRDQLSKWTCIAEHESSYRTGITGKKNKNGTNDYGIFQINNKFWCESDGVRSHNMCKISCNDLLTDDITNSVRCARKIQGTKQGWNSWSTWKFCKGDVPSIDSCF